MGWGPGAEAGDQLWLPTLIHMSDSGARTSFHSPGELHNPRLPFITQKEQSHSFFFPILLPKGYLSHYCPRGHLHSPPLPCHLGAGRRAVLHSPASPLPRSRLAGPPPSPSAGPVAEWARAELVPLKAQPALPPPSPLGLLPPGLHPASEPAARPGAGA